MNLGVNGMRVLKSYSSTLLGIGSFAINLVPFLLFVFLVSRNGDVITEVLPFGLFYAFRRTSLYLFRGANIQLEFFGWLGLIVAIIGYFLGMFSGFSPILFDVSAIGAGIGAALFPSVQKTFSLHDDKNSPHKVISLLVWIVAVSFLIYVVVAFTKKIPAISFLMMLIYSFIGLLGFYWDPDRKPISKDYSWPTLSFPNVLLSLALFLAVLLVRIGRSLGAGQPTYWGIFILGGALLVILLDLIFNRTMHSKMDNPMRFRMMVFGTCADFCSIFSAIYVGVSFGMPAYTWIIVSYAAGILLGSPLLKLVQKILPKVDPLTIELVAIVIGLLLTFSIYTYFIGIFLIRAFAAKQNQAAIEEYDQSPLSKTENSYIVSYRLMSIAGLTTQFILWISLIILTKTTKTDLTQILLDFTYHHTSNAFVLPVLITQIILVVCMSAFIIITGYLNRPKKQKWN